RRPVLCLAGRFGSDRLAPRFARAVPRIGRPAQAGGAVRLPRPDPAQGGGQHPAPARPGAPRAHPALGPSCRRRAAWVGLADPGTAHPLKPGRGKALAADAGTRAAVWTTKLLLASADHGPAAAGRARLRVQAAVRL